MFEFLMYFISYLLIGFIIVCIGKRLEIGSKYMWDENVTIGCMIILWPIMLTLTAFFFGFLWPMGWLVSKCKLCERK